LLIAALTRARIDSHYGRLNATTRAPREPRQVASQHASNRHCLAS